MKRVIAKRERERGKLIQKEKKDGNTGGENKEGNMEGG
jgi:hypothetical protein